MNGVIDIALRVAFMLGAGLLIAIALTVWFTIHRLRHPIRRTYAWAVSRNRPGDPSEIPQPRPFEPIELAALGHRLAAWDIRGDNPDAPVVIASHGWSDSKIGVLPRLESLAPRASRIIAIDAPGSGDSPGKCPLGTIEHALLAELAPQLDPEGRGFILYGWSLGAGTSIVAGVELESMGTPVHAVIAEGPYRRAITPAINVLRASNLPWRINAPIAFLLLGVRLGIGPRWKGFDRAEWARRLRAPLLVLHGSQDVISPHADCESIAAAAPHARLATIPGAGHNNLWSDDHRAETTRAVATFLDNHLTGCDGPSHPG